MKAKLPSDRKAAFETLWRDQLLGNFELGTISGRGSTLAETRNIRDSLAALIQWGIFRSILDVGCGDWTWMSQVDLSRVEYRGIDIVRDIIETNLSQWPEVDFRLTDITEEVPPAYDLVLCRDLFSHLSHKDSVSAFNNIKRSGSTYIAISNVYPQLMKKHGEFHQKSMNQNMASGYWHANNLRFSPFFLRPPLWSIDETREGRKLDVWALDDLSELDYAELKNPTVHNPITTEDFMQYRFFRDLCELPFVNEIYIYGSRAIEKNRLDSDIDLLIHVAPGTGKHQWLMVCDLLQNPDIPLPLDCVRYTPELVADYRKFPFKTRLLYKK